MATASELEQDIISLGNKVVPFITRIIHSRNTNKQQCGLIQPVNQTCHPCLLQKPALMERHVTYKISLLVCMCLYRSAKTVALIFGL